METCVDRTAIDAMRRKVMRRATLVAALLLLAAAALLGVAAPPAAAQVAGEAGGRVHFSVTMGGTAAAPVALLRWTGTERPLAYAGFLVRRRAAADAGFTDVAVVTPLGDAASIEAIFPPATEIRTELEQILIPDMGATLGGALLALRASADPGRRMQREMFLNTNYGVAIAEGLAFLDGALVSGTRYAYELWGLDAGNLPVERLGKVWVVAGQNTVLPAPVALTVVEVADTDNEPTGNFPGGEDVDLDGDGHLDSGVYGDGKVYLRWDPTPAQAKDRETQPTGFGFNVHRKVKGGGACPPTPGLGALRVNSLPVVPIPAADSDLPDFFFVDDNTEPGVPATVRGTEYCYWLVARDLLRQEGTMSAPVVACPPDLTKPRQVRGVATKVVSPGSQIQVSWTANASDPPTVDGGVPYVDDTATYNVYRFTDFDRLLLVHDADDRVATGLPAGATSWIDASPGGPSAHPGRIYWYSVTAADTALCGRPANESPHSGPARAVVYDTTPPSILVVQPYCNTTGNPGCFRDCGCTSCPPSAWCDACGASGLWPLPGDDWGYDVPPGGTDAADTWTVRLYRGARGTDFRPVEESEFVVTDGGWRLRETAFRARVSQKLDYRLRALDLDANVGPSKEPRTPLGNRPMPAYVRGDLPPVRPTVVRSTVAPGGNVRLRWHAPGVAALAGFVVRVGPRDDAMAGTFYHLPAGNLYAETSVDPPCLPRDVDGGGQSPYSIIIRDDTRSLADLANLGGLGVPGGFLETVVAAPGPGEVAEIASVDIAGLVSARATAPAPDALPGFRPAWPERPEPETFALTALFVDALPGQTDHVDLCWDSPEGRCNVGGRRCEADADCPGSFCNRSNDFAPFAAVFRTPVEAGRPDSYQQRSPLLNMRLYSPSTCTCMGGLAYPVCWQDFAVSPGTTYRYTVERFWGPPATYEMQRSEREIYKAGVPAQVAVP